MKLEILKRFKSGDFSPKSPYEKLVLHNFQLPKLYGLLKYIGPVYRLDRCFI